MCRQSRTERCDAGSDRRASRVQLSKYVASSRPEWTVSSIPDVCRVESRQATYRLLRTRACSTPGYWIMPDQVLDEMCAGAFADVSLGM